MIKIHKRKYLMSFRWFTMGIIKFYRDGFREMPVWGRRAWAIILIKLVIIFALLRLFFFPDLLKRDFNNDEERSRYILEQLTNKT